MSFGNSREPREMRTESLFNSAYNAVVVTNRWNPKFHKMKHTKTNALQMKALLIFAVFNKGRDSVILIFQFLLFHLHHQGWWQSVCPLQGIDPDLSMTVNYKETFLVSAIGSLFLKLTLTLIKRPRNLNTMGLYKNIGGDVTYQHFAVRPSPFNQMNKVPSGITGRQAKHPPMHNRPGSWPMH